MTQEEPAPSASLSSPNDDNTATAAATAEEEEDLPETAASSTVVDVDANSAPQPTLPTGTGTPPPADNVEVVAVTKDGGSGSNEEPKGEKTVKIVVEDKTENNGEDKKEVAVSVANKKLAAAKGSRVSFAIPGLDDSDDDDENEGDDKQEGDYLSTSPEEAVLPEERTPSAVLRRRMRQSLMDHPELIKLVRVDDDHEDSRNFVQRFSVASNKRASSRYSAAKSRRSRRSTNRRSRRSTMGGGNRRSTFVTDDILLATSQKAINRAVMGVLYAAFTDAMNRLCCSPNYPLMVTVGAHPDSFPSIDPFGQTSAIYFISGCADGSSFLSGLLIGYLSDKYGRRNMLLINLIGTFIFTWAKYLARHNFWTFVAMTFVNGLFGSTLTVALGYVADIFVDDRKKADSYLGNVIGVAVIGRSMGGLLTVLFPSDLFKSLWVAAFVTFTGLIVAYTYVLEPRGLRNLLGKANKQATNGTADDKDDSLPQELDNTTLFNIIFGATMDNAGSRGLIPLALAPLMFQTFHGDFISEGLDPIMREQTFRWLYSMVAIVAIPGAIVSPYCFQKYGPAVSCVVANLLTGAVTIALLYVALITPPTTATFATFATILYVSVPFCLISQLSTGPMLDRITPLSKKGFVQGLNAGVMDGCAAVFPFLYAVLADSTNFTITFWVATGISVFAAISNAPLIYHPKLKRKEKDELPLDQKDDDVTISLADEEEMQEKLDRGDFVPSKDFWMVNAKRAMEGRPLLYTRPGPYAPGNYDIPKEEYEYLRDLAEQRILSMRDNPEQKEQMVLAIQALLYMDPERVNTAQDEMGVWFKDYLEDNGYHAGEFAPILKAMVQRSFPKLSAAQVTVDNFEQRLVRIARLMNDYMEREGWDDEGGEPLTIGALRA